MTNKYHNRRNLLSGDTHVGSDSPCPFSTYSNAPTNAYLRYSWWNPKQTKTPSWAIVVRMASPSQPSPSRRPIFRQSWVSRIHTSRYPASTPPKPLLLPLSLPLPQPILASSFPFHPSQNASVEKDPRAGIMAHLSVAAVSCVAPPTFPPPRPSSPTHPPAHNPGRAGPLCAPSSPRSGKRVRSDVRPTSA